jgi:hypothetical protein
MCSLRRVTPGAADTRNERLPFVLITSSGAMF